MRSDGRKRKKIWKKIENSRNKDIEMRFLEHGKDNAEEEEESGNKASKVVWPYKSYADEAEITEKKEEKCENLSVGCNIEERCRKMKGDEANCVR